MVNEVTGNDALITSKYKYKEEVEPIQHRETRGEVYSQEYQFDTVDIDVDLDDAFPDKAEWAAEDGAIYYRWPGEPQIRITEDKVYRVRSTEVQRAEKQAYHALSMLDAIGAVIGWRKA